MNDLTGFAFLEDFVDDLRHLEESFTPEVKAVRGFTFTRPQVTTLINTIDTILVLRRSINYIREIGEE